MRVALYARVSTPRQFENALSVPDQLAQMNGWAERNGHVVSKEYIEPGASATDDRRPVFQDMISEATLTKPTPFDLIVVHSFSRFFRDMIEATLYERKLAKVGIKMVSITQHINDDPAGEMQKRIIMLFDEYQSKETGKHVIRSMKENARQGYFNGAKPPYGYDKISVGQTGSQGRIKKKLAIQEEEAKVVREIFTLYAEGKGGVRYGMKEIAKHLNAKSVKMRGHTWGIHKIHKVLSSSTYAGTHIFNKMDGKQQAVKDQSEWVAVKVPAIISQDLFDRVTMLREAYSPKKINPRKVASPTLLGGVLRCGCCGGAMTVATGKHNQYRYYKCSSRMSRGNAACKSGSIPLARLDEEMLNVCVTMLFTPEHMGKVVKDLRDSKNAESNHSIPESIEKLKVEMEKSEKAINRIYEAIETGILDLDEHLKTRIQQQKKKHESFVAELTSLKLKQQKPATLRITPKMIEQAAKTINKAIAIDGPTYAKGYLKAALNQMDVANGMLTMGGSGESMARLITETAALPTQNSSVLSTMNIWRRG